MDKISNYIEGIGVVLAMIISWEAYHSIVWSVIYGVCSWLFVGWWYFWG